MHLSIYLVLRGGRHEHGRLTIRLQRGRVGTPLGVQISSRWFESQLVSKSQSKGLQTFLLRSKTHPLSEILVILA